MQVTNLIGYLGADAECKNVNGNEFITFRIANTNKWTDENGNVHEETTWYDCTMNGRPKVFEFLKKGQLVFVSGPQKLRVYSSAKDRCMKCGVTISVMNVELLGNRTDDVPGILYTEDGQKEIKVGKYFFAAELSERDEDADNVILVSKSGERFVVNPSGWVSKEKKETTEECSASQS